MFGEIVMRFGILWRTLQFDIEFVGDILSAACLVHNFIVDERIGAGEQDENTDLMTNDRSAPPFTEERSLDGMPVVTNNDAPRPCGRPRADELASKEKGRVLRESVATSLGAAGLNRPMQKGFKYNRYGMIYMEY
jgi:hypothetical protein